jgi:hypothetical protein
MVARVSDPISKHYATTQDQSQSIVQPSVGTQPELSRSRTFHLLTERSTSILTSR